MKKWTQWMFLYFMVSGTRSLVEVHQPPVLTTPLGHDVVLPCQFTLSHNERMVTPPVLYWMCSSQNTDNARMWPISDKYEGRVALLDNNRSSSNKSIILKNVQWADSGKYLCKMSITTEREKSFRKRGNETLLMVYDTMIFNLSCHNDSLLWCEANVTRDSRFVLSIFLDGCRLPTASSARGDAAAALPYATLSEATTLSRGGKYECQLHLNNELITKSFFHYHPPEPSEAVFPEPWCLYAALLLVPATILLSLLTSWLLCRC
ncbi:uncharacterized protein [Pempheris klunzingeri]|uniref:uncharacterized protein n=1 Tax=Pempheris klunzingeri TaxID=3127111 RepID=UPI0039811AD9